jgi:preprotein translocase subunit SecB
MSDDAPLGNGTENGAADASPNLQMVAQYIKDLSFENPGAPGNLTMRPNIEMSIDLQARRGDAEHFEVELKLRIHAKNEDKPMFLVELSYAGLMRLTNVPEEVLQPILMIQAPFLLFPYARRIVSDIVRDGGMPPLMIEPIDFAALYQSKLAQGQLTPIAGNA